MRTQDPAVEDLWKELRYHAGRKEWHKLGEVIRNSWQERGGDFEETSCLSNSQHCVHVWNVLTGKMTHKIGDVVFDNSEFKHMQV